MKKIKNSLLTQYLLIIVIAILILPITLPLLSILYYNETEKIKPSHRYYNGTDIERMWHQTADRLTGAPEKQIRQQLSELKKTYPKASLYWVDEQGRTRMKLPQSLSIPKQWTVSYTVNFMKKSYDTNPFTVVAFIGNDKKNGFIVFQLPRSNMVSPGEKLRNHYEYLIWIGILAILLFFIFVSTIFFYRIRKRLLYLQKAMQSSHNTGIPSPVIVKKHDEIGQLEQSFNLMIQALEDGKKREQEEEQLRKKLIANLSHDLRTPLTTLRFHAYNLQKEKLSEQGRKSLHLIDEKINYLAQLIENLLSYTLLTAGKYPYHPEKVDIVRFVRTSFSAWYSVFENLSFEIILDFPETSFYWIIDPQWMNRILDNIFQNIYRHAKNGLFISIKIEQETIIIRDHGPGMTGRSEKKGVGIGLAIVSLMLEEMQLQWEINASQNGTTIIIHR